MRWLPPVSVAVIAAALRWFRIDAQSLWYDEGISAHQLTRTFPEILRASALDTHPPLYYWTLKAWAEGFGASEFALRSLSAVCGVLAVMLTYVIGRRLFGAAAAVVAALLLAVSPLAVYYSQEVRMYAQVTALGLLAVYAYVERRYWLYAAAALATLYSQYLGAAVLIALNVHAAASWRTICWRNWLAANAIVAIGFVPWLPTFIDQQGHALNTSPRTIEGVTLSTLTAYGGGIVKGDLFVGMGIALCALALIGLLLDRARRASLLALLIWVCPLGLVLVLGLRSGLFEVRYLVLGLPGLALLAAVGITRLTPHQLLAAPVALAACVPAAVALQNQYFDPALARDNYRGLLADIEQEAQPTDAVVLSAPNQVEIVQYYYHGALPLVGLPAQRPMDPEDTLQRLEQVRQSHSRIWLVSWAMREADPKGVIPGWLAENGFQASHNWYGSVQLSLIAFGPANVATQKVDAALDNGIVLDGYRLASRTLKPGDTLALTLVWRAAGGPTNDHWKVFTHLLDNASSVVAQRDAEPADNLRPTTSWKRGEQVEDNYGIAIPDDLAPGTYILEVGMYAGERRSRFDTGRDYLVLGDVLVRP